MEKDKRKAMAKKSLASIINFGSSAKRKELRNKDKLPKKVKRK